MESTQLFLPTFFLLILIGWPVTWVIGFTEAHFTYKKPTFSGGSHWSNNRSYCESLHGIVHLIFFFWWSNLGVEICQSIINTKKNLFKSSCVMFWEAILLDCNGYNLPACFTLQLQVCICWHNFFLGQTWEMHMIILRRRKWFRTHTDTTHHLYMLATKNNHKSKTTSTNKSTVSWCKSKEIRNPLSPSQTPEL